MLLVIVLMPSVSLRVTDDFWFTGGNCNRFTSYVGDVLDVVCCYSLASFGEVLLTGGALTCSCGDAVAGGALTCC